MPVQTITQNESDLIEAEQVRAYFEDANDLNLAGALVFSLLVYVVHDAIPWWTWVPALFFIYLITLFRAYLIWQYHHVPEYRSPYQWERSQTISGGLIGLCWGGANAAMLPYLSTSLQLLVLTVSSVVAATSTSEGFTLVRPSRLFILACLTPQILWLLMVNDRLHVLLAAMLMVFVVLSRALGKKKNHIFIEAQRLRFRNEFLAKELSRQHELLEGASNSKSRFLAAASHDLRQPLAALMIFLELLESEQLSSKGADILGHAQQATSSLRNLLDALLDISKFDACAIKPDLRLIRIQKLFVELENEFLPIAEQKGIRLHFAFSTAVVKSDLTLLSQILRNLISNALRYTPSGHILVGCRHRHGMLDIEVHDTGIGIAEDQFTKVFDEFYQIGNQERDRQQGLGLGLSIVNRAARLLGHAVVLRSSLGKGTSFIVTVPLAQERFLDEQSVTAPPRKVNDLAGRSIAVIENEGFIRVGVQHLLQTWGCEVVTADSATAMLEKLEAHNGHIDLVISDFGLRGTPNGIAAIAALRQRYGTHLPALLFTGDISKETYNAAQSSGLSILYKPATPEMLRAAIEAEVCNVETLK